MLVKSENDRLSDTQRLWIHVLTSAGVRVELCAAREKKDGQGAAEDRAGGAGGARGEKQLGKRGAKRKQAGV